MTFESKLTRCPRAFNIDRGRETAALVQSVSAPLMDLFTGTAGSSPYLATLIAKEADWIVPALDDPELAVETVFSECLSAPHDVLGAKLRQAKRRIALVLLTLAGLGPWNE